MSRPRSIRPYRLPLSILALLFLSACATHEQGLYIGLNPLIVYPQQLMVDQTTMQFDESKPGVDWGMSLVWQGDHYIISAEQNVTPPGKLAQVWQIVAVQDIPLLRQGQIISFGTCRIWGMHNSRVVAISDYDADQQWFDHFEGAWAYDYRQKDFESVPTEHLQCFNARYGLGLDKPPVSATAASPAPAAVTHPAAHP
ncbi:MAG TPA: hypothetical protein VGM47_09240 [Gammaproteobacteria bacterium]